MNKVIPAPTDDPTINLVLDTLSIKKQAIVFANTKNSAEKTAEDISLRIKQTTPELEKVALEALQVLSTPTKQCKRLAICLKKGIAFHHAGLTYKQRELIEDNFRKGLVKIICATPTLAAGVDLPAYRTIMKDLRRYGQHGLNWIPTLEYLQMAGRAGRPKFDDYGEAIAVAKTQIAKKEITERYIHGEPEEIYSKLAVEPVLRTYILSLIATGFVKTEAEMLTFFGKTFWAFQFKDTEKLSGIIMRMLGLLEEFKFIMSAEIEKESNQDESQNESDGLLDFKSASDIYDRKYKPTLIGKRVAELYIDPLTANYLIESIKRAGTQTSGLPEQGTSSKSDSSRKIKVNEFSFLQVISHTLEIRPMLRVRTKEYDIIQEESLKQSDYLLEKEPPMYDPDYDDYLNSIKTAMFFKDWINEMDEEYLLETYTIRPGELRVKIELADWLLYCAEELARMSEEKEVIKEIIKIRLRLKHGAKEELLPLLKLKNIGRKRARKLFHSGIKDIRAIKKASPQDLVQLLGQKVALNIKEQVGQKITAIPKGTRKGQTSIKKY